MFEFLTPLWNEPIHRLQLANGMEIFFKPDASHPLCSVQLWVKTGSIHEGPWMGTGVSHFVEHMVFKETARYKGPELTRLIQGAGGYLNAYTTFDRTVYYANLPSSAFAVGIEVLGQLGFHAQLPIEEVEKEKEVIFREIDMGEDEPDRKVSQKLFERAFLAHPYRFPVIGQKKLFGQLQHADLLSYYQARYVPNNCALVVVGDIDWDVLCQTVEAHFGSLAPRPLAPLNWPPEPVQLTFRQESLSGEFQLCYGSLAFRIPGLRHAHAPGLDVLSHVLGHGYSSRLWQKLREEKGLVHHIDTSVWNPGDQGFLWISYTCDPEKTAAAQEALWKELGQLNQAPVSQEDLQKCLTQLALSEVSARKTMGGQASRLGLTEVTLREPDYLQRYFKRLAGLDLPALSELPARYLVPEQACQVTLAPPAVVLGGQVTRQNPHTARVPSEVRTLSNGVQLVLLPDQHLPLLNVAVVGLGGPLYDAAGQRGACALMSNLLIKDTHKRSALEVALAIDRAGGHLGEFCGNNTFGISLEVLSSGASVGIELLLDALQHPRFKAETFQIEKQGQLAHIQENEDESLTFGQKILRRHFFGTHPYASDALGEEADLEGLPLDAVSLLHRQLCVGPNWVVAVAGTYTERDLDALCSGLAQLPRGEGRFNEVQLPFSGPQGPRIYTERLEREQAVVLRGYPGVGVLDPKGFFVEEVLDELFSGMSSTLFENVREKLHLAYFVGSSRMNGLRSGLFSFYAGTHQDQTGAVFEQIDHEVARVQKGQVSLAELQRCQTRLQTQKLQSMQSPGARAMYFALQQRYHLPLGPEGFYAQQIAQVTLEDLQAYAQAHFNPSSSVSVSILPQ